LSVEDKKASGFMVQGSGFRFQGSEKRGANVVGADQIQTME